MYMCGLCGGNMWLLTPLPPGIWNFIPHVWFVIAYTAYTLTSGMICHTTTWSLSGDSSWLWVPRLWTHIHIIHPNHTHTHIYIYICVCVCAHETLVLYRAHPVTIYDWYPLIFSHPKGSLNSDTDLASNRALQNPMDYHNFSVFSY